MLYSPGSPLRINDPVSCELNIADVKVWEGGVAFTEATTVPPIKNSGYIVMGKKGGTSR